MIEKRTSLKARILRLGIINIVVALVVVLGVSSLLMGLTVNNNYTSEGQSLSKAYSAMLNNTLSTLKQDIEQFTTNSEIVDESLGLDERRAKLNELASHTIYKDLSIAYADGKTYNDTDLSERKYFQEAMKGTTYISSPVKRLTDGSTVIMVGTKMNVEGFDGVLYGAIDAVTLSQGFENIDFGTKSDALILDAAGQVVAGSDTTLVDGISSDDSLRGIISGKSGSTLFENNLVFYTQLTDSDNWYLFIRTDSSAIAYRIWNNVAGIMIVSVILVIIDFFICIRVARRISTPITGITERLRKLSEGDIYTSCDVQGLNDETGDLVEITKSTLSSLRDYIGDIDTRLGELAKGNLLVKSGTTYVGDFEKLDSALTSFQNELKISLSNINSAVEQLRTGASQIADGAQSLSENSISQAQAASEVQTTSENILSKADSTAEAAEKVSEFADTVTQQTLNGEEELKTLLVAIDNIHAKSDAISGIVKTIEDISFQTNILSLNASIEAARAGEAGKGFSVVAGEVGNLASKSAEATKKTAELIAETLKAVEQGTTIARSVNKSMEDIVSGVENVSSQMKVIADAASEQKSAVEQAQSGIDNISSGLQSATAAAEESAASSEELLGLANTLEQTVQKYKI